MKAIRENPLKKYHSSFSKIESKIKEHPIIGFDTEDDSKGTPLLFAFYGDFPKKKYVTKHWDEALDFIYRLERPSILVAHNLEYDIANLFKSDNYLMVDSMLYASRLLAVNLYGTESRFINSMCFFAGSLKKMGEFIGLEKFEGNALSRKYATRDAEIVYTFMKRFQTKLVNELCVNLGVTIGQMAMQTYRRSHMLEPRQITYNSPNCLRAYYGGRVEIFYKGAVRDIKVCDINSCYPFVMRNRPFPDTSNIEPSSIATHEFGIGLFKVRVPENIFIPVLPYRSPDGKLFFPVGTFKGWWTYQEVRRAVEQGAVILREYQGEGTNSFVYPFESFIDTFYDLRIKAKRKLKKFPGDAQAGFDSLFYKLWQNNLYGKFCQWRPGNTLTRDKWSDHKLEKLREHPNFRECKIGPFYSYTVPKVEPPKTANFMWGIYVTAYSRLYLHEGMETIHKSGGTILYCDTDSIMYTGLSTNPLPLSSKLGDWDEESFDLGVFRQAKGYLLCNKTNSHYEIEKVACKGVPTHMAYDFIVEGMARVMRPMRLKEALIRSCAEVNKDKQAFLDEIGENVWREVCKEMHTVYIKRSGESGITYPVRAENIPDLEKTAREKEFTSIAGELENEGIQIKKPAYRDAFAGTSVPSGYFDSKGKKSPVNPVSVPQKVFYFRPEQCLDLGAGDIWLAGDFVQLRNTKASRRFYLVRVTHFKGRETPLNFWGGIWVNFLAQYGVTENLVGKYVAISLRDFYLQERDLSLKFDIYESDYKGRFDAEPEDNEKLTEKELEKLMAFDWSTICQPKQ